MIYNSHFTKASPSITRSILNNFIQALKVFEQVAGDIPNLSAKSSFKSHNLSITVKINSSLYDSFFKDDRDTVCLTFVETMDLFVDGSPVFNFRKVRLN